MSHQSRLVETFVSLADTLVDDFDVIDFLQMLAEDCVSLLDVSAAGIMLVDEQGVLRHAACSDERMRLVELFELQVEEGPCFDAYNQRVSVISGSPEDAADRWPKFATSAAEHGYAAVAGVPMRLRNQIIGALNLFSTSPGVLGAEDVRVAQAMADVATISILQERAIRVGETLSHQLQGALESRVAIEQAKGIVSEHSDISVDEAFEQIRRFARAGHHRLSDVARQIIDGSFDSYTLLTHSKTGPGGAA
jgi:GAF domain-containing protein